MTTCLYLTEATLGYPTVVPGETEEITLWGSETEDGVNSAAAFMGGENAYNDIGELSNESGMFWDSGPYGEKMVAAVEELDDPKESIQDPEIAAALDQWRAGCDTMDDLHEPSYFLEWNQGEGGETWVGGDWSSWKDGKIPQYTPEMLEQREALNWMFNFHWNTPFYPGDTMTNVIPEQVEIEMEIVAAGDSHAVAKCKYGSVFVPKGALKHIINLNYGQLSMEPLEIHKHRDEGGLVGEFILGRIQYTPGKRHWWRVVHVDYVTE